MGKDHKKRNNAPKSQSNHQVQKNVSKPQALVVNEGNKYVLGGYFSLGINLDDFADDKDLDKSTLLYVEEKTSSDAKKKEPTTIATLIAKKLEELQQKVEKFNHKGNLQ